MAANVYECMFILDSNKYARDPGGVSGKIPEMVEKLEGEVLASRLWTEQKLAYTIKGQRKGTYWLTYFRLSGEKVGDFNRACQLNDNILRNLTLKVEPRLVDTLVSHARGEKPAEATEEAAATTEKTAATEKAPAAEKAASTSEAVADKDKPETTESGE